MQRHRLAGGQDASGTDLLKLGIENILQDRQTGRGGSRCRAAGK